MNWQNLFFSFKGRISRKQFWLYGVLLYGVLLFAFFALMGLALSLLQPYEKVISFIFFLSCLFLAWPYLAVNVKRLHDRDRSGWFMLIALIPVIGNLWLIVELGFLKGTSGPNRFGSDPLTTST